tara:strand:+ start:705 stop:1310 length:606 start_codon:yes stop_codon:yes gene_type:complete
VKNVTLVLVLLLTMGTVNAGSFNPTASANGGNTSSRSTGIGVGIAGAKSTANSSSTADAKANANASVRSANKNSNTAIQGQLQGQISNQDQGQKQSTKNANNAAQDTTVIVEGDDYKDIPVSSAASTFASVCSSGASVQRNTIGFSLSASSAFCQYLSLADAYSQFGDDDSALKYVNKAAGVANRDGFYDMIRSAITLGIL